MLLDKEPEDIRNNQIEAINESSSESENLEECSEDEEDHKKNTGRIIFEGGMQTHSNV